MEQLDFYELLHDLTLEEVFQAYFDCRHHKRHSCASVRFEMDYERHLIQLHQDIVQRKYHLKPSQAFIVNRPVKREVFAAAFRDRIVHHLIMGRLMAVFESVFSDASYSCRVGKGTLYGIQDCYKMMKACSVGYSSDCYVLRLDIHGFFFHINKTILAQKIKDLLDKRFYHTSKSVIMYLIDEVLRDNPTKNCVIRGSLDDWQGLPHTKSLFYSGAEKGLPIGNLTSQIFANFYLNDFDHYITGLNKDIFYGRYVDDIVIMHPDHDYLLHIKSLADTYLTQKLGLTLHPKKISLQHFAKGFAFIGAYIKPGCIYPGKRLRTSFYQKVQAINYDWTTKPLNAALIEQTISSLNSYLGFLKYFNAWRVKLKAWNMLCPLAHDVLRTNEDLTKVRVEKTIKRHMIDEKRQFLRGRQGCFPKYEVLCQKKVRKFPKKKFRGRLRDKGCSP